MRVYMCVSICVAPRSHLRVCVVVLFCAMVSGGAVGVGGGGNCPAVNCTVTAAQCAALNRSACETVKHAGGCGACLPGYTGQHHITLCVCMCVCVRVCVRVCVCVCVVWFSFRPLSLLLCNFELYWVPSFVPRVLRGYRPPFSLYATCYDVLTARIDRQILFLISIVA